MDNLAPDPLPPTTFSPQVAMALDRLFCAHIGNFTGGLDPRVIPLAYLDWWVKLAWSPGTHARLAEKAIRKAVRLGIYMNQTLMDPQSPPAIYPLPQDRRFRSPGWHSWPYNLFHQSFLLTQQWWANATMGVPALSASHKDIVTFVTRQLLDIASPSNFPLTNPEVVEATVREGGMNLWRGWANLLDDWLRHSRGQAAAGLEQFEVGRTIAITPGKVIYRNHLMELIQYSPSTQEVYAEPLLIVPAWIMKYYIHDLSPENSLVRYLVSRGHTLFIISWRNPTSDDRDLGMAQYLKLGIGEALEAIGEVLPKRRVHAVGYCLGGTLLMIAAAAMARDGDRRLKSITLLAAQTDFSEAGELMLFINEAQVSFLESMMWDRGVLDTEQMSGVFQLLRSNDLIWSRLVREYLLGKRQPPHALMAWNADQTRMPYQMHSEYLRRIFLNNDLAEGKYRVEGKPVAISDIRVPLFVVATLRDHVAPWQSVYKIHLLANSPEVTFVLTSGGHNTGIVSEPGRPGRTYQIGTRARGAGYMDPITWQNTTSYREGSWWIAWQDWLASQSGGKEQPPPMGIPRLGLATLGDAPGSYVLQR
ncbi:MAG: alpha/beta fold hydrolase [Gammaproteobacteria bacterium]|nr:alpha/beta fold hydrolase [Gammaproteobacteria bacterium]